MVAVVTAASSPEDSRPTDCICDEWCYRGEDGTGSPVCPYCTHQIDVVYDPCPVTGFGCGLGANVHTPPCECCTPEQWKTAMSA